MSNNYYAGNVIYNNQHKELTIQVLIRGTFLEGLTLAIRN